jgi:hypothetical protein
MLDKLERNICDSFELLFDNLPRAQKKNTKLSCRIFDVPAEIPKF